MKKPVWMLREESAEYDAGYRAADAVCESHIDSRVAAVKSYERRERERERAALMDAWKQTGMRAENV